MGSPNIHPARLLILAKVTKPEEDIDQRRAILHFNIVNKAEQGLEMSSEPQLTLTRRVARYL